MAADPIDAAIAKVEAAPQTIRMMRVQVAIASSGRPAAIELPTDSSDAELAELCGWMLTDLMGRLRAGRSAPASRILVPR